MTANRQICHLTAYINQKNRQLTVINTEAVLLARKILRAYKAIKDLTQQGLYASTDIDRLPTPIQTDMILNNIAMANDNSMRTACFYR